jgi:hypothetical protein
MSVTGIIHTRSCVAHSAICVVENFRDAEGPDEYFYTGLERVLSESLSYLASGTVSCTCDRPFRVEHEEVLSGGSRNYVLTSNKTGDSIDVFVTNFQRADGPTHVLASYPDGLEEHELTVHVADQFLNDTDALVAFWAKLELTSWDNR